MLKYKMFYSYQSDRPPGFCKDVIQSALELALTRLPAGTFVEFNPDAAARRTGAPDITEAIFNELSVSDVVVADLTPVATTEVNVGSKGKLCANPNVVLEAGYAFHAITPNRVILVENEYYGSNADHFFDLRQRKLVRYKLGPDTTAEDREKAFNGLAEELFRTLTGVLSLGNLYRPDLNDMYSKWWSDQNRRREDGDVAFEGRKFMVRQHVFSPDPRLTNSASMMARNMPPVKDRRVLDLGTGCGVLAILAALREAKEVWGVDIQPEAVTNAIENTERHGVQDKVHVVEGNLFNPVEGEFDVILANLPIDPRQWREITDNVITIADSFLEQVRQHLTQKGVALITWASFGSVEEFEKCMENRGFPNPKSHHLYKIEETFGVTWYLYAIRNQPIAR